MTASVVAIRIDRTDESGTAKSGRPKSAASQSQERLFRVFLRIALLASLASFRSFLAALVRAVLAGGLCLFAAGFRAGDAHRAKKGESTNERDE